MRHSISKHFAAAAGMIATMLGARAVNGQQDSAAVAAGRPPSPESQTLLAAPASAEAPLLSTLLAEVTDAFDSSRGGWVTKNGIPCEPAVELGFDIARTQGAPLWQSRALDTVSWTWTLFDSVGGGFFHKLSDTRKDNTSFEKRTDSNASRLETLVDAWRATGDKLYRRRAMQVMDYADRVLLDGRGGFIDGQVGSRDLVPRSNGMMIHAWLMWAAANADRAKRDFALRSLDRSWDECWHPTLGMLHKDSFGTLQKAPQLSDQVEMGRAYVLAAHLCGRPVDLDHAKAIALLVETNFADPKKGGWRTQAVPQKDGKIRGAASLADEGARVALFLAELTDVTGEMRWREAARRGVHAFADGFDKAGLDAAEWALAIRALSKADLPAKPQWPAVEERKSQTIRFGRSR